MNSLTDQELLALLNDIESDRAERKRSYSDPEKVGQTICAFANDLPGRNFPGVIFIGADDKTGEPSHIPVTDELLRKLAEFRSDGRTLPLPALIVEKRQLKGADMAVITVMPSDSPPVKFNGRVWVRVGPSTRQAHEQEERILTEKRRKKYYPFDLSPIPGANIKDLSRMVFESEYLPQAFAADVLAANGRSYEERLASCNMIVSPDETVPTLTGLLTLGISPQDFIPGAKIEFLRINGNDLADDVVDSETIGGNLVNMLRGVNDKFKAHNRVAYDITSSSKHIIDTPYPAVAFQQIIYNAVLHRTYEGTNAPTMVYWFNDRIEIVSSGGPYGKVNEQNFGKPGWNDYRNPNIAAAMKVLGFVQAFGRGIATARRAMQENGNPEMEFCVQPSAVVCILRAKS